MSEVKVNKISPRTNCGTVQLGDSGDSVSVTAGVPVTVNGDLKSNALKATDGGSIISQCGTNITLGASGDTINLASGASQSGFGRTGTVDWQTGSIKTTTFTGENGKGYFVDSSAGAVTANLPASPTAGDIMAVSDYAQSASSNNITIGRNGSNIQGDASDLVLDRNGVAFTLVFVDATKGWVVTDTGAEADKAADPSFIIATGGTETECGDYKIHTFTGPGTFSVTGLGNPTGGPSTVDYLVIAGGASGGGGSGGAGGGAGGYRESSGAASGCYSVSPLGSGVSALPVSIQCYSIAVGGGGAQRTSACRGNSGSVSTFSTITSAGGGGGGAENAPQRNANSGGSGGGGAGHSPNGTGGSGNTPPVSPPQGNNGAPGNGQYSGGGGGGATGAGTSPGNPAGAGGAGGTSSINGTPTARAGGGGGGNQPPAGSSPGPGTAGGGGGGVHNSFFGTAATANTGSGGGGGSFVGGATQSGAGGSGIVIIRYKFQ